MSYNWMDIDNNFPSFTGKETPQEQIRILHDYLYQLRQGLQYSLQNIGTKNFNKTELQNLTQAQRQEVAPLIEGIGKTVRDISVDLEGVKSRVNTLEKLIVRVDDLEEWTGAAEQEMQAIAERVAALEEGDGDTSQGMQDLQERIDGEGGLQEQVSQMQDRIDGEDGLQAQMDEMREQLKNIGAIIQTSQDAGTTIGEEGKTLHIVGDVYVNGVQWQSQEQDAPQEEQ